MRIIARKTGAILAYAGSIRTMLSALKTEREMLPPKNPATDVVGPNASCLDDDGESTLQELARAFGSTVTPPPPRTTKYPEQRFSKSVRQTVRSRDHGMEA
jgi:hypothetical protein